MLGTRQVLVVEDDQDVRETLAELLRDEGYDVRTANNGEEGLAEMRRKPPALVLLDLMMPIMSGWQVLEAVRADASLQSIPIVVITAATRTRPAGATDLLAKPVDIAALLRVVREYAGK